MRTYTLYRDFSVEGRDISGVTGVYDSSDEVPLSDSLVTGISKLWKEMLEDAGKSGGVLYNGQLVNVRGVEEPFDNLTAIVFGPACFRDYITMRIFLDRTKNPADYGISDSDLEISKQFTVFSPSPIVFAEDKFIMGIKGQKVIIGTGNLGFPGGGYTERDKDAFKSRGISYLAPFGLMVRRQVVNEIGTPENLINKIQVLELAGSTYPGSHRSTALFCAVNTSDLISEIKRRKIQDKPLEAWEHKGPYWFVPKDPDIVSALLSAQEDFEGVPLSDKHASAIDGIGDTRLIRTTGKACYGLFAIGRHLFGEDWYQDQLEKHKDHVKISYGEGAFERVVR